MHNQIRQYQARMMTEEELLEAIVEAGSLLGWRVHHDRRSDLAKQQGHRGFPDVLLARGGVVIAMELKDEKGQLTEDQLAWLQAMGGPEDIEQGFMYHAHGLKLWKLALGPIRPTDLDQVLALLKMAGR